MNSGAGIRGHQRGGNGFNIGAPIGHIGALVWVGRSEGVRHGCPVGLDESEATVCARAIRPIPVFRVAGAAEACEEALRRRPLVIVMRSDIASDDEAALHDTALLCGAEAVAMERFDDAPAVGTTLLDALRKADRRRIAR